MKTNKNEQEYLVQKIRTQYTEPEHTELDELKALDKQVKAPAKGFAYIFGTVAALVLGAGMSLVMTDIGATLGLASPMIPGVALGLVGLAMALVNYPLYTKLLAGRQQKFAARIIALSDTILNKEEEQA